MTFKEIKNLFTFSVAEKIFTTVSEEVNHLSDVYEPLREFTPEDVKNSYKANVEDADFIGKIVEKLPAIREKGILVTDLVAAQLSIKWVFIQQMGFILIKLKKLVSKLETAHTIALAEGYALGILVHEAVINAGNQGTEGITSMSTEIAESKTRAIRAAQTRKKTEAAKNKAEKEAKAAEKAILAAAKAAEK